MRAKVCVPMYRDFPSYPAVPLPGVGRGAFVRAHARVGRRLAPPAVHPAAFEFGIEVKGVHMERLQPQEWLVDEIVNIYMKLLQVFSRHIAPRRCFYGIAL